MQVYNKDNNETVVCSRSVCSCNNPSTATNCKTKCADGINTSDESLKKIYSR